MTLTVPLAVELSSSRGSRIVTRELRSLRFRNIAYGGYAQITCALDRPLMFTPDEIAYYGRVRVVDTRNYQTVCEGRLEDPGRSAGADGRIWSLAAVGSSAHATDNIASLAYVDRRLEPWEVSTYASAGTQVGTAERDADTPSLHVSADVGTAQATNFLMDAIYRVLNQTSQQLARVSCSEINGATSASWANQLATRAGTGSATVADSDTWSTTAGTMAASRGGSPAITAGHDVVSLRSLWSGGAATANENAWADYYNIVVRAMLKTKTGTDITSGYSADTVLASEIVADVLGRLLPLYDGANAIIDTTSYAIEQLVYADPVNARQIIDDLLKFEPTMRWGAYESNSAGLYRFEFKAWPTTIRYEADVIDGYDSDGSAEGLYNAALVRYKTASGQIRTITRTSSVPELTTAGLTRTIPVDLGDEVASLANAQRAGDSILAQHQHPPNAGRLTIARRILDLQRGRMVDPWEIMSGNLIRLRGVKPNIDALNATDRDGVTVMRIQSVDVDASRAAADLELDSYALSTTRSLADTATLRTRRR